MKWIASMLLVLTLAGCVSTDDAGPLVPDDMPEPPRDRPFQMDVSATTDWWEAFVSPGKRDAYLPDTPVSFNQASRDVIADTLRAAGFEVTVYAYSAGVLLVDAPDQVPAKAYTVEARWPGSGTNATWGDLGLIAHYDTQAGTIEGAYDNGSGTAAVVHTCIELAKANLTRGLTCVLFDAEEVGTVASGAYVDSTDVRFDLVLGFDMVGINCPGHAWQLYQWVGANFAAELYGFVNATAHASVGDCVTVFDFNDRNSDESQFASAGIPTVRFAGGRTAGAYDQYHLPDDTPEHIYDLMDGRANWEKGFGAIMQAAYDLGLAFDAMPPLASS